MKHIFSASVTQDQLNMIAELDEFKGSWQLYGKLTKERKSYLQKVVLCQSIVQSMQQEGIDTAQSRVAHVMNYLNNYSFDTELDQIIAGHVSALKELYAHYPHLSFSQLTAQQFYKWLFRYHKKLSSSVAIYKQRPNHIMHADNKDQIACMLLQTTLPYQTQEAFENLIYAVIDLFDQKQLHPLQIVAYFFGQFLRIYPFDAYNHAVAHLLVSLLLLQHGYGYVEFIMINAVYSDKEQLYSLINRAYTHNGISDYGMSAWISFFLKHMIQQKRILQEKIEREQKLQLHVSDYAATLLNLIQEHGKLSVGELVHLTGFNKNTTKKHIQELVKKHQIIMHGKARATWYTVL